MILTGNGTGWGGGSGSARQVRIVTKPDFMVMDGQGFGEMLGC